MKKTNPYQVTEWYRSVIRTQIKPGDLCIDASIVFHDTVISKMCGFLSAFDICNLPLIPPKHFGS